MFESTLGYNLNRSKVPTLVIETGIALRINKNSSNQLFQGMLNLLNHSGIIADTNPQSKIKYPVIAHPSQVILLKSNYAGLFIRHTDLKSNIAKGEVIGEVVNASDGEILQEVTAPKNGLLFTIRENPLVYPGVSLARIAQKNMD